MSWKQLTPETSVKVKANIILGVNKTKGGRFYCSIIFSEPFLMELDRKWWAKPATRPAFAGVFEGEGTEEGKVMVLFSEAEKFRITYFEKGGGRIQAPLFECLKAVECEAEQVTYEYGDRLSLILTVPLLPRVKRVSLQPLIDLLPRQTSTYLPKPKVGEVLASSAKLDTTLAAKAGLIDPVVFLKARGIQLDRLTDGRFQVDKRQTVDRQAVLRRLNDFRKQAGQTDLTVHHVSW